jgi:hypothetical protein
VTNNRTTVHHIHSILIAQHPHDLKFTIYTNLNNNPLQKSWTKSSMILKIEQIFCHLQPCSRVLAQGWNQRIGRVSRGAGARPTTSSGELLTAEAFRRAWARERGGCGTSSSTRGTGLRSSGSGFIERWNWESAGGRGRVGSSAINAVNGVGYGGGRVGGRGRRKGCGFWLREVRGRTPERRGAER